MSLSLYYEAKYLICNVIKYTFKFVF